MRQLQSVRNFTRIIYSRIARIFILNYIVAVQREEAMSAKATIICAVLLFACASAFSGELKLQYLPIV